jgi:hypothetical protein
MYPQLTQTPQFFNPAADLTRFGASQLDPATKNALIDAHIQTPAGRQKLASSLTQPLRLRRDFTAVGRKTFLVEQLPDGALPIYDKDPDVSAFIISEEGQNVQQILNARRVTFPIFEIASNPEIPLTQIKMRRYDLIDRAQELARAQIQAAEDVRVFAVLDAIALFGFDSKGPTNPDIAVAAPISGAVLADAFASIEAHDLRVARVFMNAKDYADIRKFGRDILDIETQANLLKSGIMGILWGALIITSRLIPQGTVYITAEPEMFGRMPVQTELTVLSADSPQRRTIGFSVFEALGIGAYNPLALQRLVVTR